MKKICWKLWYENGKIQIESNFTNGLKNGVGKQWYDNGQLHVQVTYDNGVRTGLIYEWDQDGNLIHTLLC